MSGMTAAPPRHCPAPNSPQWSPLGMSGMTALPIATLSVEVTAAMEPARDERDDVRRGGLVQPVGVRRNGARAG